jgi:hypothetical protein
MSGASKAYQLSAISFAFQSNFRGEDWMRDSFVAEKSGAL